MNRTSNAQRATLDFQLWLNVGRAETEGVCGSPITPELSDVQSGQDGRAPVHGSGAVQKGTGGFP